MRNRENTMQFKKIHRALLTVCIAGCAIFSPAIAQAQTQDGMNIAKENVATVARDPFWPVGYTPRQVSKPVADKGPGQVGKTTPGSIDWEEAMKQVVINGVSSRAGNEYIAVINSEVKTVGELVSIHYAGVKYSWKVESITPPGSVKLRRHAAE